MNQKTFNYCFFTLMGFWIGVIAQDVAYTIGNTSPATMEDFAVSGFMIVFHLVVLYVINRLDSQDELEGILDEDQLNTEAEDECKLCGDPVKKGDRVMYSGDVYCTKDHLDQDLEADNHAN